MGGTIVDSRGIRKGQLLCRRREEREKNIMKKKMMISGLLWEILCLSLKEDDLREAKLNPSSLEKQRRSSQRLPCFFMPKETGKGYVTGNLCGF
jgi:hypothetical protein